MDNNKLHVDLSASGTEPLVPSQAAQPPPQQQQLVSTPPLARGRSTGRPKGRPQRISPAAQGLVTPTGTVAIPPIMATGMQPARPVMIPTPLVPADDVDEPHTVALRVGRGGRRSQSGRGGRTNNQQASSDDTASQPTNSNRPRRSNTKNRRGRGPERTTPVVANAPLSGPAVVPPTTTALNANAASWSPNQQFQHPPPARPPPPRFPAYAYTPEIYYPYQPFVEPLHMQTVPIQMHPLPYSMAPPPPTNPPLPPGPPPQQQSPPPPPPPSSPDDMPLDAAQPPKQGDDEDEQPATEQLGEHQPPNTAGGDGVERAETAGGEAAVDGAEDAPGEGHVEGVADARGDGEIEDAGDARGQGEIEGAENARGQGGEFGDAENAQGEDEIIGAAENARGQDKVPEDATGAESTDDAAAAAAAVEVMDAAHNKPSPDEAEQPAVPPASNVEEEAAAPSPVDHDVETDAAPAASEAEAQVAPIVADTDAPVADAPARTAASEADASLGKEEPATAVQPESSAQSHEIAADQEASLEAKSKPLAEPNEKPVARPGKKSFKKRAAGYENRSSGDVLDAFIQVPSTQEQVAEPPAPTPAPVVAEEAKEPEVLDNWEDVAPSARSDATAPVKPAAPLPPVVPIHRTAKAADVDTKPRLEARQPLMPASNQRRSEEPKAQRRMYTKMRMLELRQASRNLPPPESLPSYHVEKPKQEEGARRRLGPGGTARSSPAGGSSSSAAKDLDDARRAAPKQPDERESHRLRRGNHGAESGTWARGQKVRGGGGGTESAVAPVAVEPLKKSAYRWDPSKIKAKADATKRAVAGATSILNKMTPENFERLFAQLAAIEMLSLDMLKQVIRVVFEKAIDEPHFAAVYAELCQRMAAEPATKTWPFVRTARDDDTGAWAWLVDVQVDSSRLLPIEGDLEAASKLLKHVVELDDQLLASSAPDQDEARVEDDDDDGRRLVSRRAREKRRLAAFGDEENAHLKPVLPEPVGVGQLKLVPADCVIRADRALVCFEAPQQRPGVLFAVLVDATALLSTSSDLCKFGGGGFASRDDAQKGAMKKASFRRLLLNQCEEDFKKVAGASAGATALAEMATQAMLDQEEATKQARQEALDKGLPPPIPPDVLTHEEWVVKLKRRMLGIVRFIGELYKQDLLKEKIMHECISLLVGKRLDDLTDVPDDESVEATAKLFVTIGRRLENSAAKAKVDTYFGYFIKLAKDKRLAARTRFMLQDLVETRANGWKERHATDGPHRLTPGNNNSNNYNNGGRPANSVDMQRDALRQQRARESQDVRRQQGAPFQQPRPTLYQQSPVPRTSQDVRGILPRSQGESVNKATAKQPAAQADKKEDWSNERIDNRVRSTLDEHAALRDDKELLDSFDEMPERSGSRLASVAVEKYIIEGKTGQRASVYVSLATLVRAGRLSHDDWAVALGPILETLYDIAVDVPKVYDWLADLFAMLLLLKALDPRWLAENEGRRVFSVDLDPNDDFDRELIAARARFFRALIDALPIQANAYGADEPQELVTLFRPLASAV